jgi:hypothetical protein
MEVYFDSVGDFSPNSELVKISEPEKKGLHQRYFDEMTALNVDSVNYSKFLEIWNVVFPRYLSRGYVAVG